MPLGLIVGAFGQGNPGDEALLDAGVRLVQGVPGWEAVVVTADTERARSGPGVRAAASSLTSVGRELTRADVLIVPGGTVFKDLHPSSGRRPPSLLRRGLALARGMRARGRPVLLVGVGAAPVADRSLPLVRSLAATANLLILRDDQSARLLVGAGVPGPLRVGADLGWGADLGTTGFDAHPARRSVEVGVAVSHLAGDGDLAPRLAAMLRPLVSRGWDVVLEPWQGAARLGRDALLAHEVARRLGDGVRVCPPPADLAEAAHRTRNRRVVVALRFHAALVAAATGTPFVAVAHEPKLAALAERVGQPAILPDAPTGDLAVAVALAVEGGGPDREAVVEERRRSDAMVSLAQLVLSGSGEAAGLEHLTLVPDPTPA